MFNFLQKLAGYKRPTAADFNVLVDRINQLSKISGSGGVSVVSGPNGTNIIGDAAVRGTVIKIFEVQGQLDTPADGVYNCYEQTLDSIDWDDHDGADKFDDKDTTSVEVLNLYENNPDYYYSPSIGKGTRLSCWQWTDDEGNKRWVGVPLLSDGEIVVKNTSGSSISANRFVKLSAYNVAGGYYEIAYPSLGDWGFSQVVQNQLAAIGVSIANNAYGIAKTSGIVMVTMKSYENIVAGDPVGAYSGGTVMLGGPFVALYKSSSDVWVKL